METLGPHGVAVMLMTVSALFLFSRDRLPIEYSCLGILSVLAIGFELFPFQYDGEPLRAADFLAGLGNEALITILLLMILAKGVEISGALRPVGRALVRLWFFNGSLAMLATLVGTALVSAFINNTPVVVMLLPLLVAVAHRTNRPASGVLMPVGFASIVGGMSTTIGTSSNLLVINVAADLGLPPIGIFEFVLPAAIAGGVAMVYLWLVAPRLLPEREPLLARAVARDFASIIDVTKTSPLAGKTLAEMRQLTKGGIRIVRVLRGEGLELVRLPSLTLLPGDRVHVLGAAEAIKHLQNLLGESFHEDDLQRSPDHILVEIVVTQQSALHGKSLSEARRLVLSGLTPVGYMRPGARTTETMEKISDPMLRSGDVLLMQGRRDLIRNLQEESRLLILARNVHVPRAAKAPLALGIVVGVVVVAALGWMPIIASALCGVGLMLFCRCLAIEEAAKALDLKLVVVIVTSLALGTALIDTGATTFIAHQFVGLVRNLPPPIVLSCILLLTSLLTEVVTNNAVAVIATPIAVAVARELGVPEFGFVMAVLFGANMSYLTPIGYQTNLLIFSAGGYRFSDFFRAGVPLQLLMWVTLSFLLTHFYL